MGKTSIQYLKYSTLDSPFNIKTCGTQPETLNDIKLLHGLRKSNNSFSFTSNEIKKQNSPNPVLFARNQVSIPHEQPSVTTFDCNKLKNSSYPPAVAEFSCTQLLGYENISSERDQVDISFENIPLDRDVVTMVWNVSTKTMDSKS